MSTTMDAGNVALVQSSLLLLRPRLEQGSDIFCRRLFELAPILQSTNDSTIDEQQCALLLEEIVAMLPHLDRIVPVLERSGMATISQVALEEHYLTVGAALMWALEQTLCEAFTPALRLAWLEAYVTVIAVLQDADPYTK